MGVSGKREEKEATSPLNKQANEKDVESGGKKFLLEGISSERTVHEVRNSEALSVPMVVDPEISQGQGGSESR